MKIRAPSPTSIAATPLGWSNSSGSVPKRPTVLMVPVPNTCIRWLQRVVQRAPPSGSFASGAASHSSRFIDLAWRHARRTHAKRAISARPRRSNTAESVSGHRSAAIKFVKRVSPPTWLAPSVGMRRTWCEPGPPPSVVSQ
eukprot:1210892-Prymnesium_polylepis.1